MKIATWNMQRSPTIEEPGGNQLNKFEAAVREELLSELVENSVLCFLSEVGEDLRLAQKDPEKQDELPGNGGRCWVAAQVNDNQDPKHACRSLLYSETNIRPVTNSVTSGKDSAYRFSASAQARIANANILTVSVHATSGYGGSQNIEEIIAAAKAQLKSHHAGLIIGGDFNSTHSTPGYAMPHGFATNQSGSRDRPIDGFYFYENPEAEHQFTITISNVKPLYQIDTLNYKLVTQSTPTSRAGFHRYKQHHGHDAWWRMSDHAPVIADLSVQLK